MRKRYLTQKKLYIVNMLMFIGMSFEFLIRGDMFFGAVLIFTDILNLFAFQKAPKSGKNYSLFKCLQCINRYYRFLQLQQYQLLYLILYLVGN